MVARCANRSSRAIRNVLPTTSGFSLRFHKRVIAAFVALGTLGLLQTRSSWAFEEGIAPQRVLIVYNSNYTADDDGDGVQDSLEVAQYYSLKRHIPSTNILGVHVSSVYSTVYTSYSAMQSEMIQPVQQKLNALGPNNIDVILLSYGVPSRYSSFLQATFLGLDNIMAGLWYWNPYIDNILFGWPNPYFDRAPSFDGDRTRFSHSIYQFIGTPMYLVTRIAGPRGVDRALDQIDQALYADKYFYPAPGYYQGNVYIDVENRARAALYTDSYLSTNTDVINGNIRTYNGVDVNLAYTEHFIPIGLTLKWERTKYLIGSQGAQWQDQSPALTAPNAMFYAGWDSLNKYNNVWGWLPGSVGADLDSQELGYSLTTPFVPSWGINALDNGLTATCGSVTEPDLPYIVRPNVLQYYLFKGYSFAEAGTLASPLLGWVAMCVGDPLYAPFAPKTPVVDTIRPTFLASYPQVSQSVNKGNTVKVVVNDSAAPKVVQYRIDYGPTTAYGSTMVSTGYFKRYTFSLNNLNASTQYHFRVTAKDPAGHTVQSSDESFVTPAETPYTGQPFAIPGTVTAYEFDNGGEGVAYHDREPSIINPHQQRNDTGVELSSTTPPSVVSTYPGEWLNYMVSISQTRNYTIEINACDCNGEGGKFHIEQDGVNVTQSITVPNFGSRFGVITVPTVPLTAGNHILKLVMESTPSFGSWVGSFQSLEFQ